MEAHEPLVIFDADRHVMEPFGIWATYLDPALRHEAPTLEPDRGGGPPGETLPQRLARLGPAGGLPLMPVPCWRGRPIWRPMSEAVRIATSRASWPRLNAMIEGSTGAGQLASMDRQGVAGAALMPSYAAYLVGIDDMPPALAHGFAAAYNRWLDDLCAADRSRLVPVGLVARHDPALMVAQLERILERGWRGIVMRPEPVCNRTLGHPDLASFWALCGEAQVTVMLHGSTRARLSAAGADRFTSQFGLHACAHGLEAMMALVSLVEGGVLHQHPGLRFALLEAGCTWLPHWLWRLDAAWSVSADDMRRRAPEPPSVQIERGCVFGIEPDEPLLAETIAAVGSASFVFGTDFPHYDHAGDLVDRATALSATLDRSAFADLMGRTAANLLGWAPAGRDQKQPVEKGSASPVSQ